MSEHSPEPAANGSGQLSGLAPWSDALAGTASGQAANDTVPAAGQARQQAAADDLCRLSVCGPGRKAELAVPAHVPLIDLLPALAGHLGENLPDAGLEHGGWVLQRLGDPPLREEMSVAALGLRDGDVVYLRPRADQLPPLDFDDLIDGVATGISARPDRWQPDMSRRLLAGLLSLPLAAGLAVLAGHAGGLSDLIATFLALVLIGLTAACARALTDLAAANILGASAICYAGLAAAEFPLLHAGGVAAAAKPAGAGPAFLACGAGACAAAVAVNWARGGRHPAFFAVAAGSLFVAAGGAFATFARLDAAAVAGVLLAFILPLGGCVPVLAFRLAKMRLDPTPSTPEELQADLDPVPGQQVLENTRMADRYMTGLYSGLGLVIAGCLAVLAFDPRWPARVVEIDVIALLLLHSRVLVSARHRLAAVIPAVCGAALLVTVAGLRADTRAWPAFLAALVVAAGLLLAAERALPGYRPLPHWGRVGDLLQTATAVALIPAVLWLLNLYQFARTGHG